MDKLYTHTIVFADDMGELLLYSNNFNTAEEYAIHAINLINQLKDKPAAFIAEPISNILHSSIF